MNWTNCYKWEYSKNKIIIIDIDTIITVGNKKRTISRYKLIQPFKDKKLKRPEISNSEKVKICMDCMKLADTILKRPHALLCALEDGLHQSLYALYSEH